MNLASLHQRQDCRDRVKTVTSNPSFTKKSYFHSWLIRMNVCAFVYVGHSELLICLCCNLKLVVIKKVMSDFQKCSGEVHAQTISEK